MWSQEDVLCEFTSCDVRCAGLKTRPTHHCPLAVSPGASGNFFSVASSASSVLTVNSWTLLTVRPLAVAFEFAKLRGVQIVEVIRQHLELGEQIELQLLRKGGHLCCAQFVEYDLVHRLGVMPGYLRGNRHLGNRRVASRVIGFGSQIGIPNRPAAARGDGPWPSRSNPFSHEPARDGQRPSLLAPR